MANRSAIPASVDVHCLDPSGDEAGAKNDLVAIVGIRQGRRVPPYRLAFLLEDGQLLSAGDAVLVQPQPCKIKLADPEES